MALAGSRMMDQQNSLNNETRPNADGPCSGRLREAEQFIAGSSQAGTQSVKRTAETNLTFDLITVTRLYTKQCSNSLYVLTHRMLNSCTESTSAITFSTGVSGNIPWPRLKM